MAENDEMAENVNGQEAQVTVETTEAGESLAEEVARNVEAAAAPSAQAPAPVVYTLKRLESDVAGPVMVVGYGSPMKAVVRAAADAEISELYVTGSEDKRRGFSCSGRAEVIALSKAFDAELFSNEYAIVDAADRCRAKALLLATPETSDTPLLRAAAAQKGIVVLRALDKERYQDQWIGCDPDPADVARTLDWRKCPKCKRFHEAADVFDDGGICPTCGELYRLDSDERIAQIFDADSFEEWDAVLPELDPLDFPGFQEFIERGRKSSGHNEAVRTGKALLGGHPVAFGIMESGFMMGSMGNVVGEKIASMIEQAVEARMPVIIFTASGGARMQEGLVSLMQMAKVSVALERLGRAGLPYFSVITDPTTGGVTASFAMQGDVIISEPHALIGFAGQRVIQDTIKQTLPEGFQTAEFALEHGLIDAIVERCDLRDYLIELVEIHLATADVTAAKLENLERMTGASIPAAAQPFRDAVAQGTEDDNRGGFDPLGGIGGALRGAWRQFGSNSVFDSISSALGVGDGAMLRAMRDRGIADVPSVKPVQQRGDGEGENRAWESVTLARNIHRPTAMHYIDAMVDDFIEFHGDRCFGDDGAIVGGIGWIDGCPVTVLAEEKGVNLKDRIARNFGCPQPWGYRKSRRLMEQAQKFGRPIVCLVDTQGAFCGMEAEERGQGNAIADNLMTMAGLTVPVVSVVLGEGGSGGALALAMGNRVAMQEHAVYSVLSPEGFASILWKDRSRAAEAAAVMKMSAAEAQELGIIEEVIPEGPLPAHENPGIAAEYVTEYVKRSLDELRTMSGDELRDQRYLRFRAM